MLSRLATALLVIAAGGPALAQTIYPLDRAEILSGARFDFKVELPTDASGAEPTVTINGRPAAEVLAKPAVVAEREEGQAHTAFWVRDASLPTPGTYVVEARRGEAVARVHWEVFPAATAKARNLILFIGDGMSNAHRVAARMLSKGIREGQYGGDLAMDDMPHMALVSTAGTDAIITDSANSMSAYTTGHKSCVSAVGVYCARNKAHTAHPRVENIATLARRRRGMAVGVVTNTPIQDATPAGVYAHTRQRTDYDDITRMLLEAKPEIILGGGSANFLPAPMGARKDGTDYLKAFGEAGYAIVATASELAGAAADPANTQLLGLFTPGYMDGALDRRILKKGTVARFPEQPDLVDQVKAALAVLSRRNEGFVLVAESGLIDVYSHLLDWERAVFDTIMLDNAVAAAKAWAEPRGDTLIVVVPDHTHPVSIIGTYDDTRPGTTLRDKLGVYQQAGFPDYPAPDAEGYPTTVDTTRRLAFAFSAYPDHCESGRPYLDGPNQPTEAAGASAFVAKASNCERPGAVRRAGNLPAASRLGVHAADDVLLTATGPGSEAFRGHMPNTRVFRAMATALGLGEAKAPRR